MLKTAADPFLKNKKPGPRACQFLKHDVKKCAGPEGPHTRFGKR